MRILLRVGHVRVVDVHAFDVLRVEHVPYVECHIVPAFGLIQKD